jgi:translocation and assembly module TamB
VQSSNLWWNNTVELDAQFGRQGLWPQTAKVRSSSFRLPSELTRLKDFREITGSVTADWQAGHFELGLDAAATPQVGQTNLPPIQIQLHAHGDTNIATLQTATVSAPWLRAELSQNLSVRFRGRLLDSPAQFKLSADLDRQPWLPIKGSLKGQAELSPTGGKFPLVNFTLSGSGIDARRVSFESLNMEGHLDWPSLEISKLHLTPEPGSYASLMGKMDLDQTTITKAQFEFRGPWARQFLPHGYSYQDLSLSGTLNGPLKALGYSAHLMATNVTTPNTRPLEVLADFTGESLDKAQIRMEVSSSRSKISLEAALEHKAAEMALVVSNLTLHSNEVALLKLAQPFQVLIRPAAAGQTFGMRVEDLQWIGQGGAMRAGAAVDWPQTGKLAVSIQDLSWASFADFSRTNFGEFEIRSLEATGGWTNGPASFALDFAGAGATREGLGLSIAANVSGNKQGLNLSNLVVASRNTAVASAKGFLPVRFEPGLAEHRVVFDSETPLHLVAVTDPTSTLWNMLAQYTRLTLLKPDLRLDLSGNWNQPRGELHFDAQRIILRTTVTNIPTFDDLHIRLSLDRAQARLTDCQVRVQGQPMGALSVHRARTRPLPSVGPLRDIDLKLTCQGRTLALDHAAARIGTATVALHGQADLRGTHWLAETLPPFELTLRGTNVPLTREPDCIIRSDLNLSITKTNGAPPLISGEAHLRDSFYLTDLSRLVSGGVAQPSRRPPYFSITEPPLASWRAAVHATGERFLKVRSTLFNGEVSANLNLGGTLKEPVLLGDIKIDSGNINFPFASLQVEQGLVTLSSANPYRPQLAVSAASKQFGYDIKLEVNGFADAPVIQFSSNPPLSSQQILLMVTAGTLPGGTYSLTPQQRAQTMALFLGRDLLNTLGVGEQTEQRLIIHSGQEISEVGRPTYEVEYKVSPRWSVVGEYDRFGDYNAGLKWQIYAK